MYHTDAQRVVDGWNGLWKVDDPWVPHREWWSQIRWLRTEVRQDVEVRWVPGHSQLKSTATSAAARRQGFRASGHRQADAMAKVAASWHEGVAGHEVAVRRTRDFASRLGRYYVRLLDLALDQGRLPAADAWRYAGSQAIRS